MTPAHRIVQQQEKLYSNAVTSSPYIAAQLDLLLERSKPENPYPDWDPLISTPFRYPLPVEAAFQARFKPPHSHFQTLYCSKMMETALYEHAYYFMKERIHLPPQEEHGTRTLFSLSLDENRITDLTHHANVRALVHKNNYTASHRYIQKHPDCKGVKYPSCRDPKKRSNFAIFDIHLIGKKVSAHHSIGFVFRPKDMSIHWLEFALTIHWKNF